jgi:hypothetical protein
VESVFAKIRNVRKEICRIVMHGFTGQQPPNMGPEAALAWRVRGMAALVGDEENMAPIQESMSTHIGKNRTV